MIQKQLQSTAFEGYQRQATNGEHHQWKALASFGGETGRSNWRPASILPAQKCKFKILFETPGLGFATAPKQLAVWADQDI
jgi:hypothetical protein